MMMLKFLYGVFMIAIKSGYRKWIVFLQKMLDYVPDCITTIQLSLGSHSCMFF
jgi:hypothetical protein